MESNVKPKEVVLEAVVTRKDGTVEHHGVIAYQSRNPLKQWLVNRRINKSKRSG